MKAMDMERREIDLLLMAAQATPDTVAVRFAAQALTYAELRGLVARSAYGLAQAGVARGDVVALLIENSVDFVVGYFAVQWLAGVCMPLNPKDAPERLQYCIDRARAGTALVAKSADALKAPLPSLQRVTLHALDLDKLAGAGQPQAALAPGASDRAVIMFTTGTTGAPKGVELRHQNTLAAMRGIKAFMQVPQGTVEVVPTPLYHSFGLARMRVVFSSCGTLVLARGFLFPASVLQLVERFAATGFASVPAGWDILLTVGADRFRQAFSSVRYAEIGSAAMSAQRKRELMELLPDTRICVHYGLTEASRSTFMELHQSADDVESIGSALQGVEVSIRDNTGAAVDPGSEGEICVRGPTVFAGYLGDEEGTAAAFFGPWFRTGDLGRADAAGRFWLSGRLKELINLGGSKISPIEVERVLDACPGVKESAVIGIAGGRFSAELMHAFVVPSTPDGCTIETLREFASARLDPLRRPAHWHIVHSLPKTDSGKLQRLRLRDDLQPKP